MTEWVPYFDDQGCFRGSTIKEVEVNSCHIKIQGHLGQDTKIRATGSGQEITEFSVAYSFGKDEKKQTLWWNCVHWGRFVASKGQEVVHEGYLRLTSYVNRAGDTIQKMEIVTGKEDPAPYVIEKDGSKGAPPKADDDFIPE